MVQTYSLKLPGRLARPLAALGLLLATTGTVQAQTPAATFALQANAPSTGASSGPVSVAIADVNGDGKPDALTANSSSNTLSVLLGNGAGGFTLQANAPSTGTGSGPYSVAIADVNGDSKLDALTANRNSNTLGVLLGNGAGGFTLQATSSTGANSYPRSVAIADVNGDGKLDALTANEGSSTLSVLLGNGAGGFTLQANAPSTGANSLPSSVAIADVNGDGKPDALTANYNSNTLGVLLGNGAGGFALQANAPSTGAGSGPYRVAIADVNGDGNPDALTANNGSNPLGVLLGNGAGGFTLQATPSAGVTSFSSGVAIADVNGDGKLDALTVSNFNNTLSVLLGNGAGGFTLQANAPSTGAGSSPSNIAIADVNGDGKPDALTANFDSNTLGVLLNTTVYAPTLTAASPNPGGLGQTLTLTGTNLGSPTALTINGANALAGIVSNTGTSLVVRVPVSVAAAGTASITTAGGTATLPFSVMAAPGNALAFDGGSDYVRPAGTLPATGEFTLEVWVNPSAFTYPLNAVVLADNFPTGAMHCQFYVDKLGFSIAGNNPTDQVSTVSVPLNRWTHVAVVYSASAKTVNFYQNGVLVDARTYSSAIAVGAQPYSVGTWLNGGNPQRTFTGRLDELRLYSAALTQTQVQADMLSTASAVPASLSFYLNFDQGTPAGNNAAYTTLYDLAGGTAATLTGFNLSSGNTSSNFVASYALVVPTATAATSRTSTSFIATWTAPANGTVTGYVLDVATAADFSAPVAGSPFTAPSSATSYGVTGLTQSTTYYYRVRALNSNLTPADQGAESNTVSVATPLPVVLTQFSATAEGSSAVRLAWATSSEKNSRWFEVERSADGVSFAAIGTVAAAGTTAAAHAYALRDAALPGGASVLYYRLRQIDLDSTAHYSPVRSVALASGLSLYPNPSLGGAATLSGVAPGVAVKVLDALGRQVLAATADAGGMATLPAGLAPGVYVVRAGSAALRLTVE